MQYIPFNIINTEKDGFFSMDKTQYFIVENLIIIHM